MSVAPDEPARFVLSRDPGLYDDSFEGVVVQRLPGGEPSALAGRSNAEYTVHFPGAATFVFASTGGTMRVGAPPSTPSRLIEGLFHTAALPFALQTVGYEALHASAIQTSAGVIGFCGLSGTGKTTLAYGLARRPAFRLWADDALVFAPRAATEERYRCIHLPHEPNLRSDSREFFGVDLGARVSVRETTDDVDRLAALVLVERAAETTEPSLMPETLANALTGLLQHAYCFFVDDGREKQSIRAYTDLAALVPVFRLRFGGGFHRLDATLDVIESRFTETTSEG